MFRPSDVGREIIIHNNNTASYICVGGIYKIKSVINREEVHFEGVTMGWYGKEEHYSFIEEEENKKLNIGDKIKILSDSNSIKKGKETEIKGFLGDNPNKIIVEDIQPAGWINKKRVIKLINLSDYRLPTLMEYIFSNGIIYFSSSMHLHMESAKEMKWGFKLDFLKDNIKQNHIGISYIKNFTGTIYKRDLKKVDDPFKEFDFFIITKKEAEEIIGTGHSYMELLKDYFGKSLKEVYNYNINNNNDILKILSMLCAGKNIKTKIVGCDLSYHFIKIKDLNAKEVQIADVALPF